MKDIEIRLGTPVSAVIAANEIIKTRGKSFEARPIEFCKVDENIVAIIINFRPKPVTKLPLITGTNIPAAWEFKASMNHPVISLSGTLWFFGIV